MAPSERAQRLRAEFDAADLNVAEVAAILGVDDATVFRYIREDRLFAYKMANHWRIPVAAFYAFVAELKKGKVG